MSASTLSASKPLLAGYVESILAAPVYDVAVETPLQVAPQLSQRLGNRVLLKREDLQPVFSFKIRGAYTRVARLSDEQKARGVITASAGNHAQGLALAAQRLGVRAVIVMPRTTPELKVKGVLARGGEALLHGDAFPDALAHALQLAEREGMTFVPPYDDPDVIAGQGTVAMEILRQHSGRLDAIFVPVGGGSLIAGIAAYVKHLRPDIRVIGVEPEDSNCLQAALAAGERVVLGQVGLFADGVAVAQIGACNFEVCKDHVDEVITVGSDEICAAIKDIYDDTRSITEPVRRPGRSGNQEVRGPRTHRGADPGGHRLRCQHQLRPPAPRCRARRTGRTARSDHRRHRGRAVPGSFKAFCAALGRRQITEFNYRYHSDRQAHLFVGVQTHPLTDSRADLLAGLREQGFPVLDLTDNEMAKLHIRHMVGGHGTEVRRERLFRFEFPERPGALLNFLDKLGSRWNISLFHYRNHGAADGRVLAGLQVPDEERGELEAALQAIGYPYWEETHNPAYRLFAG